MKLILVSALFFVAPRIVLASSFGGAISAGSGLSGRAVADEVEGASQNPALVPFSKGYHFRVTGLQSGQSIGGSSVRVAVLDNLPDTAVPASILYSEFRNSQNFTERDFLVNFGNLIGEKTGLGFAVGYRTRPALDLGNPLQVDRSEVYGMVGVQHYFTNEFSIAGTFEPKNYGAGLSYIYRRLIRMRFDVAQMGETLVQRPGGQVLSSLGGETFINRWLVLRLGAAQLGSEGIKSTWGVGFYGAKIKS
jgi:hypothetical protein